jgi:hypothetical protein
MPFKDYDALTEGRDPFTFTLKGQTYTLPLDAPAKPILDARRRALSGETFTAEQEEALGYQMIEDIIGRELWDEITSRGGLTVAVAIMQDAMAYYMGGIEDEGKAAPQAESPLPSQTSSTTSEHLTLISKNFGLAPGGPSTRESSPGPVSSVG